MSTKPKWLIVIGQMRHGLAYVFFIIVGQNYMENQAEAHIRSSMQTLIFAAMMGVGLFLGTQAAGGVMDKFSVEGKLQWRNVGFVPLIIMAISALVLVGIFHDLPA